MIRTAHEILIVITQYLFFVHGGDFGISMHRAWWIFVSGRGDIYVYIFKLKIYLLEPNQQHINYLNNTNAIEFVNGRLSFGTTDYNLCKSILLAAVITLL